MKSFAFGDVVPRCGACSVEQEMQREAAGTAADVRRPRSRPVALIDGGIRGARRRGPRA